MNLTEQQVEDLEWAADAVDGNFRPDYSGRAMFGKTCVAFIDYDGSNRIAAFILKVAASIENADLAEKLAAGYRTDAMGLGRVYYWPSITAEQEAK